MLSHEVIANAKSGRVDLLQQWFDQDPDRHPNDRSNGGETLLRYVLNYNSTDTRRLKALRFLLQRGADPNAQSHQGALPLQSARIPEEAAMLLDAGADIDRLGTLNHSALHLAATGFALSPKDRRFPLVRYLVSRGADLFHRVKVYEEDVRDSDKIVDNSDVAPPSMLDGSDDEPQVWVSRPISEEARYAGAHKCANFLEICERVSADWRRPRIQLARLRSLCERGRALPPSSAKYRTAAKELAKQPKAQSKSRAKKAPSMAKATTTELLAELTKRADDGDDVAAVGVAAMHHHLAWIAAEESMNDDERQKCRADTIVLERMFGPPKKSARGTTDRLPNEVFWHILKFWRYDILTEVDAEAARRGVSVV
jgi:hypothetical protein